MRTGRPLLAAVTMVGTVLGGGALGAVLGVAAPPAPLPAAASGGHGANAVVAFGTSGSEAGGSTSIQGPVVGMAASPGGQGYWTVTASGSVVAEGAATSYGTIGNAPLNQPIVGMAAVPGGGGYWLVASDGGVFTFGDAGFYGSMGGHHLNQPIVGMAAVPGGGGYWLVASDGGIFTFGDAPFMGSTGSMVLNQPVVGMAAVPGGGGYWLVAADGGIFTFGDAPFMGSTGSMVLNQPVVGMAAVPGGGGYWLVAADGGIFTFGDAGFAGSGAGGSLSAPAVGMAAGTQGYWIAFGSTADPSSALGQEELLAGLGYLPVEWTPRGFTWRWRGTPSNLAAQWAPGLFTPVLQGAIDAFDSVEGLPMTGTITAQETGALLAAANDPGANVDPNGYSYALVQEHAGTGTPETLTVWHDGAVVASTPVNTGISGRSTAIGTFPVYLRLRNQVMTGYNPDGSYYADPVQFVAYFSGSDAIHYMPRASYGYPQSLGCVELPYGAAAVVWNYTTYGTLVTVTPA